MIDSYFREKYQRLCVNRVATFISNFQVQPITITLLGCFLGVLVAPLLVFGMSYTALFFLILSGYLDTLDGSVARTQNTTSPHGAVLDIVCDRLVEFMVIFGLYLLAPFERSLLCILMTGAVLLCITSFLVVGIFVQNNSSKSFYYSPGIMERTEAFAFFSLMILLPQFFSLLAALFCFLVLLTTLIRLFEFAKQQNK